LEVSSRKRLESDFSEGYCQESATIDRFLDQSEARGLRQNVGRLIEKRGKGEMVETTELWKCLFGNTEQTRLRQQAMKEVQRERIARAAEDRRISVVG
jgi:hypothetical protein